MQWLKRNAVVVMGAGLGLVLLGIAITYTLTEMRIDRQYTADLTQLTQALQQLLAYEPRPSQENIAIVKDNTRTLKKFMGEAEGMFISVTNARMNNEQFKVYLTRAISDLSRAATNSGVSLPPRYSFTFGEIVPVPTLPDYTIDPLGIQLEEIKILCAILFQSKIHGLESIQRVPTAIDKPGSMELLMDQGVQTNAFSTAVPYRVAFRCFTAELSNVLNGLAQSPYFLMVRAVDVQLMEGGQGPKPGMEPGMMQPGMMQPLGVPVMPQPAPGAPMIGRPPPPKGFAPAPASKTSLVTVLDEKPLKVTVLVNFIKPYKGPKPAAPPPVGKKKSVPAPVAPPAN